MSDKTPRQQGIDAHDQWVLSKYEGDGPVNPYPDGSPEAAEWDGGFFAALENFEGGEL